MNDLLFENRYIVTKDVLREFHRMLIFRGRAFVVLMIICLGSIIAYLPEFLIKGSHDALEKVICYGLGALLVIGYSVLRVRQIVKIQFLQDQEIFHGQREIIIRVSNDFTSANEITGSVYHIDFSLIKKCVQTKHLMILITNSYNFLTFKKDSFTTGTYDDFVKFLIDRYPQFKIKNRK